MLAAMAPVASASSRAASQGVVIGVVPTHVHTSPYPHPNAPPIKAPVVNDFLAAPGVVWVRTGGARAGRLLALLLYALTALLLGARPASAAIDYLELPLESLLQIQIPRVSGASGYEQSAAQVPSAVTVIGAEIVGSFTGFRQDGLDPLLYLEFGQDPANNFGVVAGASHEQARRLHLAVTHGDVRFSAVDGTRRNRYGNGLYGTVFGDSRGHTMDAGQFVDLHYQRSMDAGRAVTARVYRGSYRYRADYPVDYAPVAINRDDVTSTWWGSELRYDHRLGAHQITVGVEWIATTRNQLRNFDQDTSGAYAGCLGAGLADSCFARRLPGGSAAIFVRDDVTLSP